MDRLLHIFNHYLGTWHLLTLSATLVALTCYVVYRKVLLPRPLPGIPYDRDAASRLFGDVPALRSDPGGLAAWCSKHINALGSPVCQALMGPDFLQKPIVLVADVGDARDVLLRTSEFDRSSYIIERFPLFGDFHLNMKTTEDWKLARQWSKDLLHPKYFNEVVNPTIELSAQRLIDLWKIKSSLADGRAFDVDRDVRGFSTDIILKFYFGEDMDDSIVAREIQHMEQLSRTQIASGAYDTAIFPATKLHDFCEGLFDIGNKITSLYTTAWPPALAAWWTRSVSPHFRKRFSEKESFIRKLISTAVQRATGEEGQLKTGLDHMMWREAKAASKAGRKPKFQSQIMVDETFGALIAGQHTTSAAVVWILKYLTDYPEIQRRLREEVQSVCVEARREARLPTAEEVVSSLRRLPYLRAVIEEMLRLRQAMLVPRDATCDTEVLGYKIPKGTVMLLVCQGEDQSKLRAVDGKGISNERRYPGSGAMDPNTFDPERWLVHKASGDLEFDGTSYPQLAFGAGLRSCWGRKLADQEMQIATAMLVWQFDFNRVPEAVATHKATYDITYRADHAYLNVRSRSL